MERLSLKDGQSLFSLFCKWKQFFNQFIEFQFYTGSKCNDGMIYFYQQTSIYEETLQTSSQNLDVLI